MNHGEIVLAAREIALQVRGLIPPGTAILQLHVEEHVGGSRCSQFYRVRPVNNEAAVVGLFPTAAYCLKVYHLPHRRWHCCPHESFEHMVPRARLPDHLDRIGRVGALWQLLALRAAADALADPDCVPNIHATFYDQNLRAFGTIEEWVSGREWRMELDDRLFDRPRPAPAPNYREPSRFTSEFVAKQFFLARMARLLREMGADRIAQRYDIRNWRSARRAILRTGCEDPYRGLTAVDFEPAAGRSEKLKEYIAQHPDVFSDIRAAVDELLELLDMPLRPPGDFTPLMPRANPALAQLLWAWSHHAPRVPILKRAFLAAENAIRQVRRAARLARCPEARSAWLLDRVDDGLKQERLSGEEAGRIREQVNDPDVQLYLQCYFVQLCTLPVTSLTVVFFSIALGMTQHLRVADTVAIMAAWAATFAILPISPGSIVRGLYVAWVAWRRKQLSRLRIALLLSFWRYIGFLGFPLQMAYTFPALSRFAATLWVSRLINFIPHYGKPGSLLEHRIFDLLFNVPLSLARLYRDARGSRP